MWRMMILFLLLGTGCAKTAVEIDEITPPPAPISEAGAMVNKFAFDFFAELRKTETGKNIFVSPYSISTALGMTATGARNNTFAQMKKVLHLPDDATADAYYANLAAVLKGGKGYELNTANAVWAQSGITWEEPFRTRLNSYGVDALREVDFKRDPEAARKMVNDWVELQTKEKIKDLLKSGTVTRQTRMILANAIYFKGHWATKFDARWTNDGPFTNADGTKSIVPFMNHPDLPVEMSENDDARILALSYQGYELQMVIVLPKKEDGLKALEARMNSEMWDQWMKGLNGTNVTVQLPKLKWETEYSLKVTLESQGMPDAFLSSDFSGMSTKYPLCISDVVHKAFIEVNEEGTEAAAATAVVVFQPVTERIYPPPFHVNRPFLFAIRHRGTGAILFWGRIEKL